MEIAEPLHKRQLETVLPLVNIVFLLLIFFMVAGSFTQPELFNISLAESSSRSKIEKTSLTIIISKDNEFAIKTRPYSKAELLELIKEKVTKENDLFIQLKADRELASKDFIDTMEMLSEAGLESVHLLTTPGHANTR